MWKVSECIILKFKNNPLEYFYFSFRSCKCLFRLRIRKYLSTFSGTFLKIAFHLRSTAADLGPLFTCPPLKSHSAHLSPKYSCSTHQIIFPKKTGRQKHKRLFQKLMSMLRGCISDLVFTAVERCCCRCDCHSALQSLGFFLLTAEGGGSFQS